MSVNYKSSIYMRGFAAGTTPAEVEQKCAEYGQVKNFDYLASKVSASWDGEASCCD